MKKSVFPVIIFVLMLLTSFQGYSQEFSNNQNLTKKEKKEARKAGLYANYKAIDTLIQNRTFVLEAQFLQGRYGDQVPVSSQINFIRVNSSQVTMQTGNNYNASIGYNGLGGVTAEGTINNYRVTSDDKKMNHTIFLTTITQIGTYDITLRVGADATATATITGMSSGSLTYRGNLVAPYNSRVFKGRNSL
ncbi:MAG TPA: DUF4251 domain-containing protein [Bacteroidales bacterium]|nr:DUF4251 domain-containing protein [Bacteroidales bacterium]